LLLSIISVTSYPESDVTKTQLEADFDDPETIDGIIKHLKECGYTILPIEANETAYLKLHKNKANKTLHSIFLKEYMEKTERHRFPRCWNASNTVCWLPSSKPSSYTR